MWLFINCLDVVEGHYLVINGFISTCGPVFYPVAVRAGFLVTSCIMFP